MIRPLAAIAVMTLIGVAALSGCQAEPSAPQDVGA